MVTEMSSGECSELGQLNKKFKEIFCSNKIFKNIIFFRSSITLQGFMLDRNLISLGSLKRPNSYFLCAK